jgi:hypothetical protein
MRLGGINMDWFDVSVSAVGLIVCLVLWMHKRRLNKMDDNIIKTRIVDVHNKSRGYSQINSGNAAKRAMIGGALFGKEGAAYGASTARRDMYSDDESTVMFRVWWVDGSRTIEEARRGSDKYKLFLEYLDD